MRVAREPTVSPATNVDRRLVAPTLGLLFGWITAANVVGLAGTLVSQGLAAFGQGAEFGGAALLLCGGAIAFFVIVASKSAPDSLWVAYGAAVIWALVAVTAEQRTAATLITVTAAAYAILVLLALCGPWRTLSRRSGQPMTAKA